VKRADGNLQEPLEEDTVLIGNAHQGTVEVMAGEVQFDDRSNKVRAKQLLQQKRYYEKRRQQQSAKKELQDGFSSQKEETPTGQAVQAQQEN
jgi:hypothetical protein